MKSESEVAQLCLTLSDTMDCSLPGSSVHGILQARVLEWGAIAFSDCVSLASDNALYCTLYVVQCTLYYWDSALWILASQTIKSSQGQT